MSTSKYFQLLILLVISFGPYTLNAQDTIPEELPEDSLEVITPERFLRLGVDLSAIGRQLIEPEVRQYELSLDREIYLNWFAVLEGGYMQVASNRSQFDYNATGFFLRAGADFNLLGRTIAIPNDLVVLGVRYAIGSLTHQSPAFFINNTYWGNYTGSVEKNSYTLHWLELSAGIKTEIMSNLYIGWNLKTRVRLGETRDPVLEPYYIGGFGHGKRKAPVMIHFSLYYALGK